jgi:subtilase family serine protease
VTVNNGGGTAGGSITRIYLSADTSLDASDIRLTSRTVPSLVPNATASATGVSVTIPAGVTTGSKYFLAVADATNVVVEADETNNRRAVAVTIGP